MEAAVAREQEHAFVGVSDLRADRRAHTESHCTHTAGCQQSPLALYFSVLSDPHLVLTDVCGDYIVGIF